MTNLNAVPPECLPVVELVVDELARLWVESRSGTIIIHCGRENIVVEINHKPLEVRRLSVPKKPVA